MAKRRSPVEAFEAIKKRCSDLGGECLSNNYKNSSEKLRFRCAEGHEWEATGTSILHYETWCKRCSVTSTDWIPELLETVEKKNGKLLGEIPEHQYGKTTFECDKGHVFETTVFQIIGKKTWCPDCARKDRADNHRLGIEKAREAAEARGGKCLTDEYTTIKGKALWECSEGHQWEAEFGRVIYGQWCPHCAVIEKRGRKTGQREHRKLTIEDCQGFAERKGGKLITETYIHKRFPMTWECKRGHRFEVSLHAAERREHFCEECREIERLEEALENCRAFAETRGGKCLSKEYVSSTAKLEWECIKGHRFKKTALEATYDPFCGRCAKEQQTLERGERKLRELAESFNGQWVESDYRGSLAKYKFVCENGNSFEARPSYAKANWHRLCGCEKQ